MFYNGIDSVIVILSSMIPGSKGGINFDPISFTADISEPRLVGRDIGGSYQ